MLGAHGLTLGETTAWLSVVKYQVTHGFIAVFAVERVFWV